MTIERTEGAVAEWFSSVHSRNVAIGRVIAWLEESLLADVAPAEEGWTAIYLEGRYVDVTPVAERCSGAFDTVRRRARPPPQRRLPVLGIRAGKPQDRFDSSPGEIGESDPAYEAATRGSAEVLARLSPRGDVARARAPREQAHGRRLLPEIRRLSAEAQALLRRARTPQELAEAIGSFPQPPTGPSAKQLRAMSKEEQARALEEAYQVSLRFYHGDNDAAVNKLEAEDLLHVVAAFLGIRRERARGDVRWSEGESGIVMDVPRHVVLARERARDEAAARLQERWEELRQRGELLWHREEPGARAMGFDPDGRLWIVGGGSGARALDGAAGEPAGSSPVPWLGAARLSPDGSMVVGRSKSGISVLDLRDGRVVIELPEQGGGHARNGPAAASWWEAPRA